MRSRARDTESAAATWPPIALFVRAEARLGASAEAHGPWVAGAYEFINFGLKQGWACLFGGTMLALILLSRWLYPAQAPIARYDALFFAAILVQLVMLAGRLETFDEAKVICAFHVVGTVMEVHKTAIGSWTYPGPSLFHIGGVPLFTGFMYASVGSYLARVWRLFDFRFGHHPSLVAIGGLSVAIYLNFFIDTRGLDVRWGLIAVTAILFARTTVHFKVWHRHRSMPLLLGFTLVALFIWFAENIGTVTGTWLYPSQKAHWAMVSPSKLTSWFLLMIISYTMVASVNGIAPIEVAETAPEAAGRAARSP